MSTTIQVKRGTTAQVDAVTPVQGEPVWETDGQQLAIGDGSTLGGIHVQMATGAAATYVAKSLFDAHTILMASTDNTPVALTIAASRIVGRKASGNIVALSPAELLTIINVAAGANVTGSNAPQAHKASHQNGGGDEISVTGLSGLLADDQHVLDSEVTDVAIARSILNTHTILYAVSDNTPAALAVATSRIVGRKSSGNIAALTGAEVIALLSGANLDVGAYNVRGLTLTADGLTATRVVFAGTNGVLSGDSDFTFSVDTLTVTKIAGTQFTGAVTGISLSEIENLEADKTFVFTDKTLTWTFTTPSEGFVINVTGAFNDHIFHIHQLTGNPGVATELIHLETEDSDVLPMHIEHSGNNASFEALEFELHRSSPTNGDNIVFGWHFWHDGALTSIEQVEFAKIKITAIDVSEDDEDAKYTLSLMKAGVMTDIWAITSAGVVSAPALTLPAFGMGGVEITSAKLNALVLKGTFTNDGTVTLPAFTLGGTLDANSEAITGVSYLTGKGTGDLVLYANETSVDATERDLIFNTLNEATDSWVEVFRLVANGANPTINFRSSPISNLKLGGALTLNGQIFDAGSGGVQIETTGVWWGLSVKGTWDSSEAVKIMGKIVSTSPTGGDRLLRIGGTGEITGGGAADYAYIQFEIVDPASASKEGRITFVCFTANSENLAMTLSGAGEVWADLGFNADEYYKVAGTQVVSARGAAVANPTDAASTQARLIDLLGRLRTHGLIAT